MPRWIEVSAGRVELDFSCLAAPRRQAELQIAIANIELSSRIQQREETMARANAPAKVTTRATAKPPIRVTTTTKRPGINANGVVNALTNGINQLGQISNALGNLHRKNNERFEWSIIPLDLCLSIQLEISNQRRVSETALRREIEVVADEVRKSISLIFRTRRGSAERAIGTGSNEFERWDTFNFCLIRCSSFRYQLESALALHWYHFWRSRRARLRHRFDLLLISREAKEQREFSPE